MREIEADVRAVADGIDARPGTLQDTEAKEAVIRLAVRALYDFHRTADALTSSRTARLANCKAGELGVEVVDPATYARLKAVEVSS